MEINELKASIASMTRKAAQDKESLKKATRAQKLRTERFEAAIDKCHEKLLAENAELTVRNAALKEKIISQEKKHQAERCQLQIAELQAEIDGLRIKYANLLQDTEKTREGKHTAVEKMESQTKQLRASVEMKESIHEVKLQLEEHIQSLQKKIDVLQLENLELVRKLAANEEALRYSNRQLDQRSSECQALSRQLEAALSDVREQVRKVQFQAASREEALQTKIMELEAEKSRRDNEFRLLRQRKITAEKQFEVRLKDLQLSLDQSESHKRSIQNYVDFLKNSYKTMFDEGLQMSTFGSSYFLK
uniref:Outer dense fiber of sperm tails 2-like n=1 Tax=Nothobranchius rachovii TaxID=451742 RepID=A0A1A8PY33_9TELE